VISSTAAVSTAPTNAGSNACPSAIPPPPPVNVVVAPATANVQAVVGTQSFTATVTNAQSTAVTWQVNGIGGGNSTVGTISALGLYTGPASVPTPATVTVTAVSVEDPTRSGSAQVMVLPAPPINVTVGPATASVAAAGGTQTFTATVTNTPNTTVTWAVNGVTGGDATVGTISVFGFYSAPATVPTPATVTVTATSVADTTKTASAQVTITAPGTSSPPASSGGGGGGALDLLGLLCLVTFGRRFAPALLRARRAS
jgi:uncharacterized protein (DUF58 family)